MARYTISDLRSDIATFNEFLADSGSNYRFYSNPRNGMQAVDIEIIGEDGKALSYKLHVDCGTSREVGARLAADEDARKGQIYYHTKPTRAMAKGVLKPFVSFSKDVTQLRNSELTLLAKWAKITRYRKPSGSSMSLGSAFFIHLQKRVKIS